MAMLANGVDISRWPGGLISADDVAATAAAFAEGIRMLSREGEIQISPRGRD